MAPGVGQAGALPPVEAGPPRRVVGATAVEAGRRAQQQCSGAPVAALASQVWSTVLSAQMIEANRAAPSSRTAGVRCGREALLALAEVSLALHAVELARRSAYDLA